MNPYRLYIEQCTFNGVSYTHGAVRDTYAEWGIVCSKSPLKYGDPKDVASRDWLDEHGEDVYLPADVKLKKFDAEFTFLCNGTESNVKKNVNQFMRFLSGMSWQKGNTTIASAGSRLAFFDTYNSLGRKDVRLKSFSTEGLVMDNSDNEIVLEFKVMFEIYDPYTEVQVNYPLDPQGNIILVW